MRKSEEEDNVDKQFEEGLVEYMYSKERVKQRVQINKKIETKRCH